jgi:hypothetical protein
MELDTKDNIKWVRNMVMVNSTGPTNLIISEISITITSMEKDYTFGQMEEAITETGKIIKCMEWELSNGAMEENMCNILKSKL